MKIRIGIADDHRLFVKSLGVLINTFPVFQTVLEAFSKEDLLCKLKQREDAPDIILIDVNMPDYHDGVQATEKIASLYPLAKLVALSMNDDDLTIISMIRAGCCAYLLKEISDIELEKAMLEVHEKGFYNADAFNINYRRLLRFTKDLEKPAFSEREVTFLRLACSDLTYKQIAAEMHLSERTIDGYREALFQKLNVQSRVGMALEAIRRKIVDL